MKRPTTRRPPPAPPDGQGPILADAVYPLSVFCRLIGVKSRGWRALRDAGLPVHRAAKAAYVVGAEAIAFFAGLPVDGEDTPNAN